MFYICRFSDNWSIYDTATQKSRPLTGEEVLTLTKMFGNLFNDNTKILSAAKVESIAPNKLLSLPVGAK
jgi:hypothetical protein